jgi:hypothetical protein
MMLVSLMLRGNLRLMYVTHNQRHMMYTISTPYTLISAANQLNKTPQVLYFYEFLYKIHRKLQIGCKLLNIYENNCNIPNCIFNDFRFSQ